MGVRSGQVRGEEGGWVSGGSDDGGVVGGGCGGL